jgi:hypothetical protein
MPNFLAQTDDGGVSGHGQKAGVRTVICYALMHDSIYCFKCVENQGNSFVSNCECTLVE